MPKDAVANQSSQQAEFTRIVTKSQAPGKAADNDMQRGGALYARSKAFCILMDGIKNGE